MMLGPPGSESTASTYVLVAYLGDLLVSVSSSYAYSRELRGKTIPRVNDGLAEVGSHS